MKIKKNLFSPFYYFLLLVPSLLLANVGGVSGSNQFTVSSDGSSTTWKIVSVSVTGDPVFPEAFRLFLTTSTGLDDLPPIPSMPVVHSTKMFRYPLCHLPSAVDL